MNKWIGSLLATIIAGIAVYWLTIGIKDNQNNNPKSKTQQANQSAPKNKVVEQLHRAPSSYDFTMIGLDKLAGEDCEMDTDPQDTVKVNFSSSLSHTKREVFLSVRYDAKEYKGNGTKIGKQNKVSVFKSPAGKEIIDLEYRGSSSFTISDYGAVGRNHGFRSFGGLINNSYWTRLEYKVDDKGSNDCASAGVKGQISFVAILSNRQ